VSAATLVSIAVTPANPSISKGGSEQFTATGTYTDSSTQDLTSTVTWASADTTVATITATGLATGVGTGTSTISATLNGLSDSTTLSVTIPHLSPVAVKDNSQAGYYQYGLWTTNKGGGYLGSYAIADPATSSTASNRWILKVPAGQYDIWATWVSAASNATNAGYSIYDGFNKLGTVQENQQVAPGDGQYGGVLWAKLGTFTVTKGQITVAMSASGANGNIVADGIILVPSSPTAVVVAPSSSAAGNTYAAGQAALPVEAGKTTRVIHHALSHLQAKQHPRGPQVLIGRSAVRERVSLRMNAVKHHTTK
jgi:hypothetical protein